MKNKKILIILGIIAVAALTAGLALIFAPSLLTNNPNGQNPTPTVSETPLDEGQLIEEIKADPLYAETVSKYSQYLNSDTTNLKSYKGNLVIPSLHQIGKYIDESFFNLYFVSGYWENKDGYSDNAINKYIEPLVSTSFKDELLAMPRDFDSLKGVIFMPDPSYSIPTECAEDWVEEVCFTLPPQIKEITVEGVDTNTAVYNVIFQMDVAYQANDMPEGAYVRQQRTYNVNFTMENTNSSLEDFQFADIKVNSVFGSLDINNSSDSVGNQ